MITENIQNLIKKYGGAVPRYTSYPTAVKFHDQLTATTLQAHLQNLDRDQAVSLYIHIPFCHSLCHYCGCHTKIVHHTHIISAYIDTLCDEIRLAASYSDKTLRVASVHFGGGSPNYAAIADLQKILATIRDVFPLSQHMQINMECDPRLLNTRAVEDLAHLGLSRASLGIQDFDAKVQKAVNRIQTYKHIQQQVDNLRANHIDHINFDLIVGLPEQTRETVKQTAHDTVKIRPSRIAVFAYAHVPWMKKHQLLLEKYSFPTPEERFLMQQDIQTILCEGGYQAIGIDHYALPQDSLSQAQAAGTMQRNFQGYSDDPATIILGFGLSAISQFKQAYTQNTLDATAYRQCIAAGRLPVKKGYTLSPSDIITRDAIMNIMCYFHLNSKQYPGLYLAHDLLTALEQDGIISRSKTGEIQITQLGMPFTRVVASCFDYHLHDKSYKKENRHAKAI